MGFKKGFISSAAAVAIIASSFGYLMRDCINFGKIEGDIRPAAMARKEEKAFKR
ncbi:hypothetical protein HYX16_05315 [Candidatus Woesearchaeota archaeon]|nr:hypothetical protein [Candidatus Woesearchaeota archaeon]